jgi:hypothetical protein
MLVSLSIPAGLDLKRLRFGRSQNDTRCPDEEEGDEALRVISCLYEKAYGFSQ